MKTFLPQNEFIPNSTPVAPRVEQPATASLTLPAEGAVANLSDGALYGSLPTGEIEPSVACASSEAATDPGTAPVAATEIQSSCCCEEVYPRYAPEKLGSVKSEVAIGQQETAATVSGREPVAADLCPRCKMHPIDPVLLGNQDEGHICGQCWIDDRTAGRATLTHNAVTQAVEIQSSCSGVGADTQSSPRSVGYKPVAITGFKSDLAGVAPGLHEAINDDLEQLIGVAGKRRRRPLALPPFAPDFPEIWKAMHDKSAPRTVLDPLWADASPLFLKG